MFNKLTKDGVNKYTAGTDAPSGKVGIIANADEIGIFIWCEDDIDIKSSITSKCNSVNIVVPSYVPSLPFNCQITLSIF